MEDTFLVCFDFNKLREKFIPNDEFNYEAAVGYMEECDYLKDKLLELFPNFTIPLSNNTFLVKTSLQSDNLLGLLVTEMSYFTIKNKEEDKVKRQIYVAKVTCLKSYTFSLKQLEIEYLNKAICKPI